MNFLECVRNADICPKAFPPTNICINNCTEFSAISKINFINGDLIVGDCDPTTFVNVGISQALPTPIHDVVDIFPNLLGINGTLYIVGTQYKRIIGFSKLRFVTGSIIIVNNPNLIIIPTFPSLLNVGGQIITIPTEHQHCPQPGFSEVTGQVLSNPAILCDVLNPTIYELDVDSTNCNKSSEQSPCHNVDCDNLTNQVCGRSAIIIGNNCSLRKIIGFEALRQVKDGIFISDNHCLEQIYGFIHLYRTDRLVISGNCRLIKIVGFCYIDTINQGLYIINNNDEAEFDLAIGAFVTLETAGKVVVEGNKSLKVFKLDALRIVVNDFIVRLNDGLEELSSSLCFVGELFVENNKKLSSIKFQYLEEVNQSLNINANCSLLILDIFNELRRVNNGITISENKQLTELKGFNKLKYIGSACKSNDKKCEQIVIIHKNNGCDSFSYVPCVNINWASITRGCECEICDNFSVDIFDKVWPSNVYQLPDEFFKSVCKTNNVCGDNFECDDSVPNKVSFSLIIYGNQRLRVIGGFNNLKHCNSNIYIVNNSTLHTINTFGQLAFALDVWIRNNRMLKYVIGLNNLLLVRDLVIYEAVHLNDFNNIKSLEFAQDIAIEAKTIRSVKYPKNPIPTVLGYTLYYSYVNKC